MATHSRQFNLTSYAEKLEFYFAANDVKEADKQRAVLFSICSAATYLQAHQELTGFYWTYWSHIV